MASAASCDKVASRSLRKDLGSLPQQPCKLKDETGLSANCSVLRSFLGISLRAFTKRCLRVRDVLVYGPIWDTRSFAQWKKISP